jgi:cell wall-associated NlpC family hydrolase
VAEPGQSVFAAASALVGTRFRLHGRDVKTGLDCVGLVLAAHAAVGEIIAAPDDYPLRGWPRDRVTRWIQDAGLRRATGPVAAGDVLLSDAGFGQWHFAVLGPGVRVHADARARRVRLSPYRPLEGDERWRRWF